MRMQGSRLIAGATTLSVWRLAKAAFSSGVATAKIDKRPPLFLRPVRRPFI
jgi:hypothetical protein